MENVKQQILVLPNIYNDNSSSMMIGHMISHILRDFLYHRNGKVEYFAADYEEGLDLTMNHKPDIIMFDRMGSEEEAQEAVRLAETVNRGSRIFFEYGDKYLEDKNMGANYKRFTYSAESPEANFYAQKITERPEGGFTLEIVFQPNPSRRKGLTSLFLPAFNRGLIFKTAINSLDRADIVHAVKTFAVGSALSIEPKYITKEISTFVFDNFRNHQNKKEEPEEKDIEEIMDRKEFEED